MKQRKSEEEKNEKHITGNDAAYYKYGRKRRIECMQNTSKRNFRPAGLCVSVERLNFYRMKQYKNCINANKMIEDMCGPLFFYSSSSSKVKISSTVVS